MTTFVELNNDGVAMLQQGGHLKAINTFRRALDSLRVKIDNDNQARQSQIKLPPPPTESAVTSNNSEEETLHSVPVDNKFNHEEDAVSPHNTFCLYCRAFRLSDNCSSNNTSNAAAASATATFIEQLDVSVVLLFNMALSCHHKGLTGGDRSSAFLLKALGIYKMIVALIDESNLGYPGDSTHDSLKVLLLALWSNMGHIHSHFFEAEEMRRCREQILAILRASPNFRRRLTEGEFVVFFLNAASTDFPSIDRAPAA